MAFNAITPKKNRNSPQSSTIEGGIQGVPTAASAGAAARELSKDGRRSALTNTILPLFDGIANKIFCHRQGATHGGGDGSPSRPGGSLPKRPSRRGEPAFSKLAVTDRWPLSSALPKRPGSFHPGNGQRRRGGLPGLPGPKLRPARGVQTRGHAHGAQGRRVKYLEIFRVYDVAVPH